MARRELIEKIVDEVRGIGDRDMRYCEFNGKDLTAEQDARILATKLILHMSCGCILTIKNPNQDQEASSNG